MNIYKQKLNDIEPNTDDDVFMNSVFERNKKKTHTKLRSTCAFIIVLTILAGTTLTAGAMNDWDYGAVARYLFGGRQNVVDGMHGEIQYTVKGSLADGIKYEVSGLYADNDSLVIAIDVISDDPIFASAGKYSVLPIPLESNNFLKNHKLGKYEDRFECLTDSVVVSGNVLTVLYQIGSLRNEIAVGNEYTIKFPGLGVFKETIDHQSIYFETSKTGAAGITFTVDKLAMENSLTVFTDIEIDNGYIIRMLKINPFRVAIYVDGIDEFPAMNDVFGYEHVLNVKLLLNDGSEMNISGPSILGSCKGGEYDCCVILPNCENTALITFFTYYRNNTYETIDVSEIVSVEYLGATIPLR